MCIVVLVTYTESTADMLAVAEMVDRDLTPNDLARGLATDGLSALLAGFMNSFPDTAYAENVGLIGMTGVRSRWVVTVCGIFLAILGLIPKVGAIVWLAIGLIPTIQPAFYQHFPADFQVIFGSSITSTVIVVFVLNLVFNHWGAFDKREGAVDTAVEHGAVSGTGEPAGAQRSAH
jgi:xanthine/uracil permease